MRLISAYLSILLLGVSCTSIVTPDYVVPVEANPNSGFLGFYYDAESRYGILTPEAGDKYSALIKVYGGFFIPEMTRSQYLAIHPEDRDLYVITEKGLERFMTMNVWAKSGISPSPPSWVAVE